MERILRVGSLVGIALALALALGAEPAAAMGSPAPSSPPAGASVQSLPAFGWHAVGGADHYEFQISADPSFNSSVLGGGHDQFTTYNTWATLDRMVPNGTYWWHVRAISKSGGVSAWSSPRSVKRAWTTGARVLAPANGSVVNYGTSTLTLTWKPVPLAAKYLVLLATDANLSNLVGGKPIETDAASYTPSVVLAIGTYYWAVAPEDAGGNQGARSKIASFHWTWASATKTTLTNLVAAPEVVDPQFSWQLVPGAANYDVEINPSQDFAAGSKVCCDKPVVGTSFSPTQVLPNNTYYWRVRAVDIDGDAGQWNNGPSLAKTFDTVPPVSGSSIKNLHMRDNSGNGGGAGFVTASPIAVWDPVPGASSYEVDVGRFNDPVTPGDCDWNSNTEHWQDVTAVPAWTPLGHGARPEPFPSSVSLSQDNLLPVSGHSYCVRVRAGTDRSHNGDVWGEYTYLPNAFTFAATGGCNCPVSANGGTYISPVGGAVSTRTPFFTWNAIPGAASYYVIVSKDPSFTTIVDYGFTNIPAYAPRHGSSPTTYSDETTLYYWAVLPSGRADGSGAPGNPSGEAPANFQKRSTPPSLISPSATVEGPPMFRWTPVEGARYYRLQVSPDKNFGDHLDETLTDSTAYTATKTYPANAALYARVRAEDENKVGLTWSETRQFRNVLPSPRPRAGPARSDLIPTWAWFPVRGAVSYDLHAELPNGSKRDFNRLRSPAFTATTFFGTGVFHWQARAEFPEQGGGTVPGPYTRRVAFTFTLKPPTGAHTSATGRSVLYSWQPKLGVKSYRVQVASSPDFAHQVDNREVEGASYAPTLGPYGHGGRFYWRVASVDEGGNVSNYTPTRTFTLAARR